MPSRERAEERAAAGAGWRRGATLVAAVLGTALAYMSDDMLSMLGIIVLPALAGLAGASRFAGPAFSAAYPRALTAAAVMAGLAIPWPSGRCHVRRSRWRSSHVR